MADLLNTIRKDDAVALAGRLEGGLDINALVPPNADGMSLLHCAATLGAERCLALLLEKGASMRQRDTLGWTPLHRACKGGCTATARQLLAAGAPVRVRSLNGQEPLHLAARSGVVELLGVMLAAGGHDVNCRDGARGHTPLHQAIESGSVDCVRLLLDAGADRYLVNGAYSRYSVIEWACRYADEPVVRVLLAGQAPEVLAAVGDEGGSLLHAVIMGRKHGMIPLLVAAGVPVDIVAEDGGRTPLYRACELGETECVAALLAAGADPVAAQGRMGRTALHVAARLHGDDYCDDADVVTALLHRMAPDLVDGEGRTPLEYAVGSLRPVSARLLLAAGAGVDEKISGEMMRRYDGRVRLPAFGRRRDMLTLLLEYGLDPGWQEPETGDTMLHKVVLSAPKKDVEVLLACPKVDVNGKNRQGDTALLACVRDCHNKTAMAKARLLLESGADPELTCNDGETAMTVGMRRADGKRWQALLARYGAGRQGPGEGVNAGAGDVAVRCASGS